jgi:predicted GNAT family acetyltransferase
MRSEVVEHEGAVVAMCTHNATLPDSVPVGGVFTASALRGRGHARAVVCCVIDRRTRHGRDPGAPVHAA